MRLLSAQDLRDVPADIRSQRRVIQTLIVERGKFPGAKNTWGGALFGPTLSELIPEFWKEAPVERFVASRRISFLSGGDCLSLDYTTPEFKQPPYDGFVLLRSKFDRWFAGKGRTGGRHRCFRTCGRRPSS